MPSRTGVPTAAQIRAARALLGWSREALATESGVSVRSLARLEQGEGEPYARTVNNVLDTLEAAGIVFLPGEGVRRA